jgi:SAM-dependent methyltransferase
MQFFNEDGFQFKQQFDLLSTHTPEYEFTVPYIVEHVVNHLPQREHFIDIGAGRGNLSKPLSKHFRESSIVEPNKLYYQEVLAWAANHKVAVIGYNETWLNVDFEGKYGDLFLMSHVLYYVPTDYWLTFINKAYEALNPDGCIVIILNSLTNDVTRLYKEFLQPHEWWEIASAEAVGAMLRREGYFLEGMKFKSNIYADTAEEIHQLIDFLLLGRAKFDNATINQRRESYAEAHLKKGSGYVIHADAGLIIVKKESKHA